MVDNTPSRHENTKKSAKMEAFQMYTSRQNSTLFYAQVVGVLRSYPGHDSEEFSHSDYDIKVSKFSFSVIFT